MITIRPMRWWDIPSVHGIEESCFPDDSWSVDQFWRELAGATRDYVVADSGGTVVGYAGISSIAPDSDLQTLAVDPGHRGSGLGKQLLASALERARERGATSMILEVRADNVAAQKLYAAAGFETIATRTRYYPDGSDALIMRRRPLSSITDGASA